MEILKQPQYATEPVSILALIMFALEEGYFDRFPIKKITQAEVALKGFAKEVYPVVLSTIDQEEIFTEDIAASLKNILAQAIEQEVGV